MGKTQELLEYFEKNEEKIFADLKCLVDTEAMTDDLEELAKVRQMVKGLFENRLGVKVSEYSQPHSHNILTFSWGDGNKQILMVGHCDTVQPIGSIRYEDRDGEIHGAGAYDMKGGLISILWSIKAYQDLGYTPVCKLVILINSDEETGSLESRDMICKLSKESLAAIVCEPSSEELGEIKTGRKGHMRFNVEVFGKAAHAGNRHKDGVNAIWEMAKQIDYIQNLTNYKMGTTFNVGICNAGTTTNAVPAKACYSVDCRFFTTNEGNGALAKIKAIKTSVPGTTMKVNVDNFTPPMEETKENIALYKLAREAGEEIGLTIKNTVAGGYSDGNRTAFVGTPTLDGMGCFGRGAHSPDETVYKKKTIGRMAVLASTILKIN